MECALCRPPRAIPINSVTTHYLISRRNHNNKKPYPNVYAHVKSRVNHPYRYYIPLMASCAWDPAANANSRTITPEHRLLRCGTFRRSLYALRLSFIFVHPKHLLANAHDAVEFKTMPARRRMSLMVTTAATAAAGAEAPAMPVAPPYQLDAFANLPLTICAAYVCAHQNSSCSLHLLRTARARDRAREHYI